MTEPGPSNSQSLVEECCSIMEAADKVLRSLMGLGQSENPDPVAPMLSAEEAQKLYSGADWKPDRLATLQIRLIFFGNELLNENEELLKTAARTLDIDERAGILERVREDIQPHYQRIVEMVERLESFRNTLGDEVLSADLIDTPEP